MKHLTIIICALASTLILASPASAQLIPPGGSQFNPPPPPPLPPPTNGPSIAPQAEGAPRMNFAPAPRPSFSDKIESCLDQAAGAGAGPEERATYSRSCANR
jgi:hypothetical protein